MHVCPRRWILAAFLVIPPLAACGDSGGTSEEEDTGVVQDTTEDASDPDIAEEDAAPDADTAQDPDLFEFDTSDIDPDDRLPLGELCTQDIECRSDFCFQLEAGADEGVCTTFCTGDEQCALEDFDCVFLANSGGDFARICVPNSLCIDNDEDGYGIGPGCIASDCDDDRALVNQGQDEVCDGQDNDCDGNIDENPIDANTACETGFPGRCSPGRVLCQSGFPECVGDLQPIEERCDGEDNDCDGLIDEGPDGLPLTESCYGGAPDTEGIGLCQAGARVCNEGAFGACEGQVLPFGETCNGEDDDCDGEIDEGDAVGGFICNTGLLGACATGTTVCEDEGTTCVPINSPAPEICDGLDNDCDGLIDEGPEPGSVLERACYDGPEGTEGVGACEGGVQRCGGGEWGRCLDQVVPTEEQCNLRDDDCDGEEDEGAAGGGNACSTGLAGACGVGVTSCVEGVLACEGTVFPGDNIEVCDGFDNDCDGAVDEDEDGRPIARACYDGPEGTEGVGACTTGVQTCSGGEFGRCIGQVLPSTFEICDGEDNDCNGVEDDGNPGGGLDCATASPGACAFGETSCVLGALVCVGTLEPGDLPEVCDGFDNDCDGGIDEDLVAPLCTEQDGVCAGSTQQCGGTAGWLACGASNYGPDFEPREVSCDGRDNDCDGDTDDDLPPQPCPNQNGVCAGSIAACGAELGWLACDATAYGAFYELGNESSCDNLDNDCDGARDEDFQVDGRFTLDTACGNCFTDCTEIFDRPNGFGVCDASGPEPTCVLACEPGTFNLNNVPADGCEFVLDPLAVYVSEGSPAASDAPGCGDGPAATGEGRFPCASIGYALTNRGPGKERVLVANGAYEEVVTVVTGIDLLGGYRADTWERSVEATSTALRAPTVAGDVKTLIADGVRQPTTVEGFLIYGANAFTPGANSYAVYVRDADEDFVFRSNIVYAGAGASGARGADGTNGQNGVPGAAGNPTSNRACSSGAGVSVSAGGSGGALTCTNPDGSGTTDVSGGTGGFAVCPAQIRQEGSGSQGANAGGTGGAGGWGHRTPGSCFPTAGQPETGTEGGDGPAGSFRDGVGGLGCDASGAVGSIVGGEWRGGAGLVGAHGLQGAGGGGGGAGSGQDLENGTRDIAGTGGGGGSGGCAAQRAQPGTAGGGSFAVFVLFDAFSPPNAGRLPTIEGNTLIRNLGGNGGDGGNGGAGGDPGAGALGGPLAAFNGPSFCVFPGAKGGFGARGGHGGGGGGGCGGLSFDLFVWGTGLTLPYNAANTFPIPPSSATGGRGGSGGNSPNPVVGVGTPGVDGTAGNVGVQP